MASHAVARETVVALRQQIARIEGRLAERMETPGDASATLPPRLAAAMRQPMLRSGIDTFDAALGGGLPLAGLVELHGAAMRESAVTAGFALALIRLRERAEPARAIMPVLWIATAETVREAGQPYAPGIASRFSLPAERLIVIQAPKLIDTLWVAEEAAHAGIFSSILIELRGSPPALDLVATRRLHRRALIAGHPLFLIRQSGLPQPTAAPLRMIVAPERASERRTSAGPLAGSIGPPVFQVSIDKSRLSKSTTITLEWADDAFHEKPSATHSGIVVPATAGGAPDAPTARTVLAFPQAGNKRARLQPAREQYPARRGA